MAYVELKKVLRIVDTVSSDEGIKKKYKAIRKRLKELPVYKLNTQDNPGNKKAIIVPLKCFLKNEENCPECIYNKKAEKCDELLYTYLVESLGIKEDDIH